MHREPFADRWDQLLRQEDVSRQPIPENCGVAGKRVLITGAGGFIGTALAKIAAAAEPQSLVLLDHSEQNLYQIDFELRKTAKRTTHTAILGDVTDAELLGEVFEIHQPETIFHAAAFKHVPLMEANPLAAARNNALGTWALAKASAKHHAERLVMISTDKAVNPRSVMGATKRIAEDVLQAYGTARTRMNAVRFGNVFGSVGSVVPLFQEQIAAGGPVTVTHPEVSRYFLTLGEAVDLVFAASARNETGSVFIPELGEPIKIVEVAKRLIRAQGKGPEKNVAITFTGLRPGDKMKEELIGTDEAREPAADAKLWRVKKTANAFEKTEEGLRRLEKSVRERNLAATIEEIRRLAAGYEPSEAVKSLIQAALA